MLKLLYLFPFVFVAACITESSTSSKQGYLRWVGDIEFNPALDDPDFLLCHGDSSVRQYFNFGQGLQYEGEKKAIIEEFSSKYKPVASDDSGLVRIRFIVNCRGETDRFRMIAMNNEFEEKKFDARITHQLLSITKDLSGWKILPSEEEAKDYYQYLIFKIDSGKIIEIMP